MNVWRGWPTWTWFEERRRKSSTRGACSLIRIWDFKKKKFEIFLWYFFSSDLCVSKFVRFGAKNGTERDGETEMRKKTQQFSNLRNRHECIDVVWMYRCCVEIFFFSPLSLSLSPSLSEQKQKKVSLCLSVSLFYYHQTKRLFEWISTKMKKI